MRPSFRRVVTTALLGVFALFAERVHAQFPLAAPPINYLEGTPSDAVFRLQTQLEKGEARLEFEPQFGYLRSLLKQLNVPVSSQGLVFSKTSLQVKFISPRTPRSIYFNDEVYVGWVPGGNIEISAVDPQLAANFYVLQQQEVPRPQLVRRFDECLQCHSSMMTRDVPGHVVRSVPVGADGHLLLNIKSFLTDHSSPLSERWGGWYVTGEHGKQRHLGNRFVKPSQDSEPLDLEPGANITDLSRWFDTSQCLAPHSDIVALMVLEHQVNMHNRLARANFLARAALFEETSVKQKKAEPAKDRAKDIALQLRLAADPVVEHLLFAGEIKLTDKIVGRSGFAVEFSRPGPRDSRGRSLRELDLQTRLFKYPCSYLIYSRTFDQLPSPLKAEIYRQLWQALNASDAGQRFRHLSPSDRQAIREIVRDTQRDLPDYWQPKKNSADLK